MESMTENEGGDFSVLFADELIIEDQHAYNYLAGATDNPKIFAVMNDRISMVSDHYRQLRGGNIGFANKSTLTLKHRAGKPISGELVFNLFVQKFVGKTVALDWILSLVYNVNVVNNKIIGISPKDKIQ